MSPRRGRTSRLVGTLLALGALVGAGAVVTAAPAHAATTTELEAPDFASEVYGDPWDYSNAADLNTDLGVGAASISGGKLHVHLSPGERISPVDTTAGSLPYGRDGAVQPIDSSRYNHLSFDMDQPLANHIGAVYWWTCREKVQSCTGGMTFPTVAGDHVYDLDLGAQSTLLGKVPWTSGKIVALRLDPVVMPSGESSDATFDWMRLHGTGTAHAAMPPGNYGSYTIVPRPEPVVDTPNPSQGEDLATTQRGKPWVFTDASNATGVTLTNARLNGYDANGLNATNTTGDSQVHFPVQPFDGNKYHVLQWDMTYDGSYSLADGAGGGKMARLIWNTSSTGEPQIGNDLLTYSNANTAEETVDLTNGDPLDEDAVNPRVGWAGQTITTIRFDPNEDPGALTWHLKSLHIRATPTALESTNVTFHDAAWVAGATATVTATSSAGTITVGSGIPVAQGENSVPFALNGAPTGTYTVSVAITHPAGGTTTAKAGSPIVMQHDASHDPKGAFDSIVPTATGATVSGWGFDPDGAMSVRFYEGSTYLGAATPSTARADIAKAYPSAPAQVGWSSALHLGVGTHTICAYGISVGAGQNTTYGCKTVTVTVSLASMPTVDRISGPSRYDTSVALAQAAYAGKTGGTVYVATGTNYPDALAAGPVAAKLGGPLLLTAPTSLPDVVAAELRTLAPRNVVIVGGTSAVSGSVADQIRSIVGSGGTVTRVAGSDRFDTARVLDQGAFGSVSGAYVATGTNYPDALAAAAAAGASGLPVVLVNGGAGSVDPTTVSFLRSLGVQNVIIVGGTSAVSAGIGNGLAGSGFSVGRIAGTDRFDTAARIAETAFPSASHVYLATGTAFPDALAGSALAASQHAPLLTTRAECVPSGTAQELGRLGTSAVTVIGGTAAVSDGAAALQTCG